MSIFYTLDEVSKHDKEDDLWIIIHNGIYNVTKFLKEHPGGEEVLLELAGRDATECFDAIGHSTEAVQLRDMYKVGDVSGGESSSSDKTREISTGTTLNSTESKVNDDEPWDYVEHKEESSPWILLFLGLGVLIYAIIFYYIF